MSGIFSRRYNPRTDLPDLSGKVIIVNGARSAPRDLECMELSDVFTALESENIPFYI